MGISHTAIIHKGIGYRCSFFVLLGYEPALLGMPECEWLKLLTVNCKTADDPYRKQLNEQTRQDKFEIKNNNKGKFYTNNMLIQKQTNFCRSNHRNRQGYKC